MKLKQLYDYLGSYVNNGYGELDVSVENVFGEGGDLNAITLSNDMTTIVLKESYEGLFFEGGLYEMDAQQPFVARIATGEEGPGVKPGSYILERSEGNNMMHTIACIPKNSRFTGQVVPLANFADAIEIADDPAKALLVAKLDKDED